MAELQKNNTPVGNAEMAQRFVQFVMMQTQNIYYLLGRIPSPDGRPNPPANLEGAKLFIDQLEMVQEKTRNNLSAQESQILEEALKNSRLAFVEASGGTPASMMPKSRLGEFPLDEDEPGLGDEPDPRAEARPKAAPSAAPASEHVIEQAPEPENKKKFSKSYG